MSILDDIAAEQSRNYHIHTDFCKVTRELDRHGIPQDDRDLLLTALRDKSLTLNAALRILRKRNVNVAYATLSRHVQGTCACPSDDEQ